jgi:hypothetical protein
MTDREYEVMIFVTRPATYLSFSHQTYRLSGGNIAKEGISRE